jgi:heme A synthase
LKSLHRLAFATSVVTALQLLLGGLVHNTRSSLACPDWPLCYGQVFPPMHGGILVEHSHRLTGATVGILTIALLVGLWRLRLRGLGLFALGLVVLQGVLGGLTVIFRLPTWISTTHLAISQVFFCTVLFAALRTRASVGEALPQPVQKWTVAAAGVVFVQMVLGAYMRHLGAGLACVEVPLCKGSIWPPSDVAWAALRIHMVHRLMAVAVFVVVTIAATATFRAAKGRPGLRALAIAAPLLVCVQIALGLLSITTFLDAVPVTAHLGVAAALLATLFSLHVVARGPIGATVEKLEPAERLEPAEALP